MTGKRTSMEKEMANCSVSQLEISPLIALLNMIKDNYFDQPQVFQTLIAVLHDYNHNLNSASKAMKYIQLLLSDKKELAQCLLSLLPLKSVPVFEGNEFNMDSIVKSVCPSTSQSPLQQPQQQQTPPSPPLPHGANNSLMQTKPVVIICNNCFNPIIFYTHQLSAAQNCVCQSPFH